MATRREAEYKPLLLTTTMRNPERMRPFLSLLATFKGRQLTDSLCTEIMGEAIRRGLVQPMKRTPAIKEKWTENTPLSNQEVDWMIENNPQEHKEAGFARGWPSRFKTYFGLLMLLGHTYFEVGKPVEISPLGEMFIEEVETEDGDTYFKYDEQLVFLNTFVRYHRRNPMQRVLNHNRPLILLLEANRELQRLDGPDSPGISRKELAFLIVWRDNDGIGLARYIHEFRKIHGATASDEVVFDRCDQILGGFGKVIQVKTIVHEYPDELLRKFRLTGLFSLRGGGRYVANNGDYSALIDYILADHSELFEFRSEREYFEFASEIDPKLIGLAQEPAKHDSEEVDEHQASWLEHFGLDTIRKELVSLARQRPSSDSVLKLIPEPLRLEFLSTLLLRGTIASGRVLGNYRSDDVGFPLSHAPGNSADIELELGSQVVLYEVTLMKGRVQVHQELVPITRHLRERLKKNPESSMFFIAPTIHPDADQYVAFVKHQDDLSITNATIEDFALGSPLLS
jgi:hypothetical protein